ncbi:MAG: helix-turn-helix domain-containing protein [Chlamydiia bacterium]
MLLIKTFGCVRFVFNWAHALKQQVYQMSSDTRRAARDCHGAAVSTFATPSIGWIDTSCGLLRGHSRFERGLVYRASTANVRMTDRLHAPIWSRYLAGRLLHPSGTCLRRQGEETIVSVIIAEVGPGGAFRWVRIKKVK